MKESRESGKFSESERSKLEQRNALLLPISPKFDHHFRKIQKNEKGYGISVGMTKLFLSRLLINTSEGLRNNHFFRYLMPLERVLRCGAVISVRTIIINITHLLFFSLNFYWNDKNGLFWYKFMTVAPQRFIVLSPRSCLVWFAKGVHICFFLEFQEDSLKITGLRFLFLPFCLLVLILLPYFFYKLILNADEFVIGATDLDVSLPL